MSSWSLEVECTHIDIQTGKSKYNKLLLQNGSASGGGYNPAIHHDSSVHFLWQYRHFDFNSIILFPANRELHSVSQPGHHRLVVMMPYSFLAIVSNTHRIADPERFIVKGDTCGGY